MPKKYCYHCGKITPYNNLKLSPYNLGFLRSYGVFDFLRTVNGKSFLLDEHWKRLENSANKLNLKLPINKNNFEIIIKKLLKKNNCQNVIVRSILTGGVSDDGITLKNEPTFFIFIEPLEMFILAEKYYKKGVQAITAEYQRFLPEIKTTNYIALLKEQPRKIKTGAKEIIYINKGNALEGATSNLFIVKNNQIITPRKDILLGTTRNLVINLAKENGFLVKERVIKTTELFSADEVFLTTTSKGVFPVTMIDGKKINNGKVGENSKKLRHITDKFMQEYSV